MRKAKDAATLPLFPIEDYASEIIAGIDEAGRGPLCGNVVAAAVILDPARPIEGLRDSKKLSEARREELAPVIRERALAWGVGEATPEEIAEYPSGDVSRDAAGARGADGRNPSDSRTR